MPWRAGTNSVAWGDMDGDGDLDLVAGIDGGYHTRLYRNQDGLLEPTPVWEAGLVWNTRSVALGDVDGDGDLDLAVGNYCTTDGNGYCTSNTLPTQLYITCTITQTGDGCNGNSPILQDSGWIPAQTYTTSIAWGDVDGDGDLDLAVGNYREPNWLYRNQSGVALVLDKATDLGARNVVAPGDVDGDGDLDLAVGNGSQPIQLYRTCAITEIARKAQEL